MRQRKKVGGTVERPRLVVFRSLTHISAQVIDDTSGTTVASASSTEPSVKASFAELGGDPRPRLTSFPAVLRNVKELEDAALGLGMVTLEPRRQIENFPKRFGVKPVEVEEMLYVRHLSLPPPIQRRPFL